MKPLISIVLPTFNGEKYLESAIESILNQTYSNFELIIVDDCSNDNTPKLLRHFENLDSRVRIITNDENLKLPASLNVGHRAAKGMYLTWTSDDNLLMPNFLEGLLFNIETTGADVIYSDFEVIDHNGNFVRIYEVGTLDRLPFENIIGASFMYTAEVYAKILYREDLHGIEDYDFWMRAAQLFKFISSDEVLYKYRIHKYSLTSSIGTSIKLTERFESNLKIVIENLKSFSPESKKLLFNFQRRAHWDWKYFFKHRKKFEQDLKDWLIFSAISDCSYTIRYLEILRELLLHCNKRSVILRLILCKPQLISKRFSRLATLGIFKRLILK